MNMPASNDLSIWQYFPKDWKPARLKHAARFSYGDPLTSTQREEGDIPVFGSNGIVGYHKLANTLAPLIVVGRKGSFGKITYSESCGFVIDTAYLIDSRYSKEHLRWLYYALQTLGLDEISQDTGVPGLSREKAYECYLGLPSFKTQKLIARFLDRKTAAIDTLIAKKQRLIQLLEEKRTALINQVVTKGLNPNAPMKDSGISWIGEIPEHWEVLQIKRAFVLQRGVDTTKEAQTEGIVPVVSSGGIASYHNVALAKAPGVLVGRKGTIGKVHYVEQDYWPHSTALWVINFYKNHPRFVFYKLLSMKLENLDTGSSNPTLNRNLVHPIETSWPPKIEQIEIANFLDSYSKKFNGIKIKIDEQIEKLQEYRRSLITAAVTGKLDISEVEPDV
jgi:type I restriction enzyme, S subunit